ncbi:MAG: hypothetical protein HN845_00045 [Halieaceae bacterium]|jgi:hypothetical protein|nr:hypothetical protein [Halieaceae bacterium]
MRGLAEFIMRGRWQALGVAVLGSGSLLFGWVSAAAIALVTLRNGSASGGWLTLWAILPAIIIAAISGDTGSVLLLLGTFSLAVILRESVSLSLAVMASVPLALLGGAALTLFNGVFLQELVATFNQALAQFEQELAQGEAAEMVFNGVSVPQVAALLATGNAVIALLSLILGRYWQASLYNPGGFGEEFRALRLPVGAVLLMASAALILWWMGADWRVWSAVVVLPLTIVGFSLLHAFAKRAGKGVTWLALMYSLWIVLDPVKWLWVGCVVIDTFADVRGRWSRSAGQGPDGD